MIRKAVDFHFASDAIASPTGGASAIVVRDRGALTGPATRASLAWRLKNWCQHRRRGLPALVATRTLGRLFGVQHFEARLSAVLRKANGERIDYGVLCTRLITNNGVGFIVDAFQNLVEPEIMKYHGVGTGTTAEAQTDSALVTESTTALNPDSTRATGSLTEGASANIFRTVGTVTFDATAAITEHGLFSQSATGGGVLFDRSVFSAINVASGDSIQFTYDATYSAGG